MKEIDLHGLTSHEVKTQIEALLLNEYYNHQYIVRIIVGQGQGIVRASTIEIVQNLKFVERYEQEHPSFGGSGSLIVYLKIPTLK